MRIDKWLWAARFFKTRGLAQQAVAGGRVKLNGERVKVAHAVKAGDAVLVRIAEFEWDITVRGLSERRGPAAEARQLYEESEAGRAERQKRAAQSHLSIRIAAGQAFARTPSGQETPVPPSPQ